MQLKYIIIFLLRDNNVVVMMLIYGPHLRKKPLISHWQKGRIYSDAGLLELVLLQLQPKLAILDLSVSASKEKGLLPGPD